MSRRFILTLSTIFLLAHLANSAEGDHRLRSKEPHR